MLRLGTQAYGSCNIRFFFLIGVVKASPVLLGEKAMALVLRLLSFFARPKVHLS